MILQHLKDFEWENEPQGVFFIDKGMKVIASDENFFFITKDEDFTLTIKWSNIINFSPAETGIMIRLDEQNYAKCYVSYGKESNNKLFCDIRNFSNQDISILNINKPPYLQIKKTNASYKILYSYNLETFEKIREFTLIKKDSKIQAGAYISSKTESDFQATLSYIDIK